MHSYIHTFLFVWFNYFLSFIICCFMQNMHFNCHIWSHHINIKYVTGKPVVKSTLRSKECEGGTSTDGTCCRKCSSLAETVGKLTTKSVHPNTPLSTLPPSVLVREVKAVRGQVKQLKIARDIEKDGEELPNDISEGLVKAIEDSTWGSGNELMELFWQEQKKAFSISAKGMRWHPMMIRFAIYLQFQSPRAYQALKDTGVLRLPNKSTLRDYTNVIQPKSGFQHHVFEVINLI